MEDRELLKKFKNPLTHGYAFSILMETYQKPIYWHIRRMVLLHEEADDLTQEVFIKVWKSLDRFKFKSKLRTWIYKIATRECLYFLRRKKLRAFFSLSNDCKELKNQIDTDPYISGDELQKKLQKALLCLPQKQRLVFNMKYYDEMTYKEIASILGTSIGGLKASYHLAKKKIEKYLLLD